MFLSFLFNSFATQTGSLNCSFIYLFVLLELLSKAQVEYVYVLHMKYLCKKLLDFQREYSVIEYITAKES